jgi:hypothetical protein
MIQDNNEEQNNKFSIVFKYLDEAKQSIDFQFVAETIEQSNVISEEIEKLREIVDDYEQQSFSIITTV